MGLRQGEELRHLPLAVHAELHHGPGALGVQVPEEADKGRGGVEVPRGAGRPRPWARASLVVVLPELPPRPGPGPGRGGGGPRPGAGGPARGPPPPGWRGPPGRPGPGLPPGQGLRDEMPPVGGAPGEGGEEASRRGGAAVPDQVPHRPSARMEPSPTARATHSGVSSLTCVPCTTSSPPFSIGGRPAQAKSPAAISRKMGAATWLPWIRVLGWWTATTTVNRGRSAGTNPANQAVNTSWE